jgi:hypothetical protein
MKRLGGNTVLCGTPWRRSSLRLRQRPCSAFVQVRLNALVYVVLDATAQMFDEVFKEYTFY